MKDAYYIEEKWPKAYKVYKDSNIPSYVDFFDAVRIRIFPYYSAAGLFGVNVYHAKQESVSAGDHDWRMLREGHLTSYETRKEAVDKGVEIAFTILEKWIESNDLPRGLDLQNVTRK